MQCVPDDGPDAQPVLRQRTARENFRWQILWTSERVRSTRRKAPVWFSLNGWVCARTSGAAEPLATISKAAPAYLVWKLRRMRLDRTTKAALKKKYEL